MKKVEANPHQVDAVVTPEVFRCIRIREKGISIMDGVAAKKGEKVIFERQATLEEIKEFVIANLSECCTLNDEKNVVWGSYELQNKGIMFIGV